MKIHPVEAQLCHAGGGNRPTWQN